MQRRAPQAQGDGGTSSALRWALHLHVAFTPCSTLETDVRPEIRLRVPTPPGAPSPTTLAPPPIDAAPHLRRCPHRAKDARGRCQRSPVMFKDCAACALSTLQTIRALMIFYSPELMPHLCRTSVRLAASLTTRGLALVLFQSRFLLNAQRRQHLSRCRNLSQSSASSMGSCGSYSCCFLSPLLFYKYDSLLVLIR
ncbi:hypothetical protein FB107DRAFT_291688 [Schizophyllum commune]